MASCPICATPLGAPSLHAPDRLQSTPGYFGVAVCPGCGAGRTLPTADQDELARFYPPDYGPYQGPDSPAVTAISRLIRGWQAFRAHRSPALGALEMRPPGVGLDIGAGRGDLAAALAGHGWRMTAIEPSATASRMAARRGVDVRTGTLQTVALERGAYDAAVFHHSLEHVAEPLEDLRLVRDALRPGGLVLITLPNFGSWQARRFRGRWYPLDLPRHRTHFTRRALATALDRTGFDVVQMTTTSSSIGLIASIQYAIAGRCLFPSGIRLRVASGIASLGLPLAVLLDRLAGDGDVLHAVGRRRPDRPG